MRATIRKAGASDLDAIVAFGSAVVPPHYEPIIGAAAAQAQLDWWRSERMAPAAEAGRVHVAVVDDNIVGVCETGELNGEQVIWKLYVAPEFRNRSLGAELLRRVIGSLPVDVDHVLVEHVAGNTAAARFYEREGFTVVRVDPATASGSVNDAVVWRRRAIP
jgi:ribosomal protein S18 acetylase RimI-like enzyme